MPQKWSNDWPAQVSKMGISIKSIYPTRLTILASISGAKRDYTFEPGEVQEIEAPDARKLLAMRSNPNSGCCGGAMSQPQSYFTKV